NAASWYVYYYLALLTLAEALVLLVAAARRGQLGLWAAAQLAVVLAYAPWLAIIARRFSPGQFALPPDTAVHPTPLGYLLVNWQNFTVGFTTPPGSTPLLIMWGIVTVAGGIVLARHRPALLALLLGAMALPVVGASVILLARPF